MRALEVHHIGHAVLDLDAAVARYETLLGATCEHREVVPEQGVEAASMLVGGDVTKMRLYPGVDPKVHKFRFGWTYVRGLRTRADKQFFYIAPKLTDALLLGGFAALVLTDTWPRNRYGQLALTVGATGLWVDFSKDVVLFSPHNDVVKLFSGWCMTGWKQLPARLVYASLVVASGYVVARSYQKTFGQQDDVMSVPLLTASF